MINSVYSTLNKTILISSLSLSEDNPCMSPPPQILMYENSHIVVYGYIEAWTYHPMLNISVIPQRRYVPQLRKKSKSIIFLKFVD